VRPAEGTYPAYYKHYLSLVKEEDVLSAFTAGERDFNAFCGTIPKEKENHAYAEGKWTVKQVLLHICDTERILCYRALRFARKDPKMPLPFDENLYGSNCDASQRTVRNIVEELNTVRNATISLYKNFSTEALHAKGLTGAGETTVLGIGFMICGHCAHHLSVIRQRYF
jgi:hypothetical protein